MSDVATRLTAWANTDTHTTPMGWMGDRANGSRTPTGDQLNPGAGRGGVGEWASASHGFDALGRVRRGADPVDLVSHVFDNRLNALGLADWLRRRNRPEGANDVEAMLKGVLSGG